MLSYKQYGTNFLLHNSKIEQMVSVCHALVKLHLQQIFHIYSRHLLLRRLMDTSCNILR